MIRKSEIFNFDVCSDFSKLLDGKNFDFPLNSKTAKNLKNKKNVRIITIQSSSKINDSILKNFPNLRLLVTRTVGTDHINFADCQKAKVVIKNIPDYGSFAVAEHVFALLLSLTRKVIFLNKEIRNGLFTSEKAKGFSLEGKTFGIIGAGRIGLETIKLARAFKMKIFAYDMFPNDWLAKKTGFRYVSLNELLKKSDVISLNIPLTKKTKHLIGEKEINKMKKGVILINTSRGAVIDTQALIKNINKFRYVGLDVLEDENRFSENHPLLTFKNVIITSHCAFYTDKSVKIIAKRTKEIIENFERGEHG